ncbi:MAG: four-carbon acid sugar kinase family protein [Candidatus Gastranaerophilales bacterium]|nr:four-carbon acid sugar kinase family protein [Candidatus Gastranaerophilales bacterium]
MSLTNATIVIADDLTGANDTALQYFRNGKSSKIVIELEQDFSSSDNVDVWAISTESRNIDSETAIDRVIKACETLSDSLGIEDFYKKIDSTLRGNVGSEIAAVLEATKKEAAIIAPAYIEEERTTIGGYQLLHGMVLERTQCALDPKAPIYDSYIPDILKKNLNSNFHDLIDCIGLNVVSKGAAPIIGKIKELVEKGKKLIVIDAMSNTDLEQIAFAIDKCGYDILPCGSAGLANAINKIAHSSETKHIEHVPNLARLIVSGSATQLTYNQILKLKENKPDICYIDLTAQDVISNIDEVMVQKIVGKLSQGIDVVVHSSEINNELTSEETENILIDAGIAKDEFKSKITDFLAELTQEINLKTDFILVILGGETSFKCAKKIDSKYLEILDAIMPAIPLCIDMHGKIIVTKSGNFGSNTTLIDIINHFDNKKSV